MNAFEEVWSEFASRRRLDFGGHTDPDFRGDHTCSAAFVIPVDTSPFQDRLAPLRDALRPFPFVSLHPDYFMHISLVLVGFVDDTDPDEEEMTSELLEGLAAKARSALTGFGPFRIDLENLGAFPSAAYVEAHDKGGEIEALREKLVLGCGLKGKPGPPHLTLAYFKAPDGTEVPDALVRAIGEHRPWPVGEFTATEVHLTVLDLCDEYARPKVFARLPLI